MIDSKSKKSRGFTVLSLAAASALLLSACGSSSGAPAAEVDLGSGPAKAGTVKADALKGQTLTFVSYGGLYQDGQMAAAITPFGKESGAKILSDGPTEYSKIKAQVESNNVSWDIVDTGSYWAASQCGTELMPLDLDIIDVSKVPEGLVSECAVPAMQYANVLMYNTDKYKDAPTSWADFFDTAKYPGKRSIDGTENIEAGIIEGALIADGVDPKDLYPLDMDRAFKKLDTIKDSLVYWTTGAQAQQMLESGEVDMSVMWSGRAFGAVDNGAHYAPLWDASAVVMDTLTVPKGAKNPQASMAAINYYLGAEQQAKLTEETSYSPINTEAKPNLSETAKNFLITDPAIAPKVLKSDFAWWGKNYTQVAEQWVAWVAK
ncbi:ABC transporter substrate-binding protein [Paeniglutamicibacter cryotolerans]|uniref:Putative spermidine/putrescine transport system substrate-binding protein n=1 Tax=Paeniglutamicibacter cryotolerans TaxID=670079 RepID=A0A839QEN5_9MICC|nr:ABC transporter substrate-binding protein [Paeniglutamicibacter cryotolerans]MBB2994728.1 putative spermidine/putrescine transport system substrate-binding protein [Paeniglutamicibacter cryotolerans]